MGWLWRWRKRNAADYKFQRPRRDLDAVVFVHGFNGHFIDTWGKFPELLDSDPDLPALDILSLGYPTGFGLLKPPIDRTGKVLVSRIGLHLPHAAKIVVVCHSMGGVVALSGVRSAMVDDEGAQHPPICSIARFVLFATPLKSQHLAAAARRLWFGIPYCLRVFNAQIRQLGDGRFGAAFERDVVNRIYRPTENSKTARQIPIHVCLGYQDKVVSEVEARGVIVSPRPDCLEHTHASIKEPTHHGDERYLVLKRVLEQTCGAWFREAAVTSLDTAHPHHSLAGDQIRERLSFGVDARLRGAERFRFDALSEEERERLRESLTVLACRYAAASTNLTVAVALNTALRKLAKIERVV